MLSVCEKEAKCECVRTQERESERELAGERESHFIVIVFNIYWKNVKKM